MTKTTSMAMAMAKHNSSSSIVPTSSSGQIHNIKDMTSSKITTSTTPITITITSTMIKITKVSNINRTTRNNNKIMATRPNKITTKPISKTKATKQLTTIKIPTKTNKPTTLTIPINTNSTSTMIKTESFLS